MTLEELRTALDGRGNHLGDLIWWTLAEARIDRSTLENIWAGAQLAPEYLPDPPTAEKALKSAVREAALGQPDRLIRLGKEDEAEIVFAVVRETKHTDGSITYQQETRVILDRQVESVSFDIPGHDLAGVITTRFGELRSTHMADDVRRAMMKVLDACAAVTLRDHGGVYWVPAPYAETVRRLQGAIEKIGSSRVYLLPVHASRRRQQDPGRRRQGRHRGRARGAQGRGRGLHGVATRPAVHPGPAPRRLRGAPGPGQPLPGRAPGPRRRPGGDALRPHGHRRDPAEPEGGGVEPLAPVTNPDHQGQPGRSGAASSHWRPPWPSRRTNSPASEPRARS